MGGGQKGIVSCARLLVIIVRSAKAACDGRHQPGNITSTEYGNGTLRGRVRVIAVHSGTADRTFFQENVEKPPKVVYNSRCGQA